MLLTTRVRVQVQPKHYSYWLEKGYILEKPYNEKGQFRMFTLDVSVNDLPSGSKVKVARMCDGCGVIKEVPYRHSKGGYCVLCRNQQNKGDKAYNFSGGTTFVRYKHSAKRRGYIFKLTVDEFNSITDKPCHYCGDTYKTGIDRKDNDVGYLIENCLPCCEKCNRAKLAMSYSDFLSLVERIYDTLLSPKIVN